MTRTFACLVVVGMGATSAMAQPVNNAFRLDLAFAARTGDPNVSIQDITGPVTIQSGQTVRLELRYRIADLQADNVGSSGLAAVQLHLTNDQGPGAGAIARSQLTQFQADHIGAGYALNSPILDPDATGAAAGSTGLIDPFRGGLDSDIASSNGFPTGANPNPSRLSMDLAGNTIVPLSLAAPGQLSFLGSQPSAANTDSNQAVWALYSFDYTAASTFTGPITFTMSEDFDIHTGVKFAFFTRSASNPGINTFQESQLATIASITINVVPAPAAGAGLGLVLLPLMLGRRRTQ